MLLVAVCHIYQHSLQLAHFAQVSGAAPRVTAFLTDSAGETALKYAELNRNEAVAAHIRAAQADHEAREAAKAAKAAAAAAAEKAKADAADAATREAVEAFTLSQKLVGKQVCVQGLKGRPELNGLVGFVVRATGMGRCTVALKVGDEVEQVALKPTNLSVHTAADAS